MPEAAGRGEGETGADDKVIWVWIGNPGRQLSRVLSEPNVTADLPEVLQSEKSQE
jgi:hypothetical protein